MILTRDGQLLEQTFILVKQLSPEYRLRLVQHILQTLIQVPHPEQSRPLRYGEFQGENMSTPEDFTLAEWRPTDEDWYGT